MSLLKHLKYAGQQYQASRDFWQKEMQSYPEEFFFREKISAAGISGQMISALFQVSIKDFTIPGYSLHVPQDLLVVSMAVMRVLLKRHTASDHLVLHTLKTKPADDNILPVALNLEARTVRMLLDEIRRKIEACFKHQDFPLEILSNNERKLGSNLQISTGAILTRTSCSHDLEMSLSAGEGYLNIHVLHSSLAFTDEFISGFIGQFMTLLRNFSKVDTACDRLTIVDPQQLDQILNSFNNTSCKSGPVITIPKIFENQVLVTPDYTAINYRGLSLTYAELNKRANILAHDLKQRFDLAPEDRVAILLEKSDLFIVAMMGILKSGAAYVPVDPQYPKERIEFLLADSNPKVVITLAEKLFDLTSYEGEIYAIDLQLNEESPNSGNLDLLTDPAHLAYIIYTSGSTGKPKGVLIEHRHICNTLSWRQRFYQFKPGDITLQMASISFDSSVEDILGMLLSGGTLLLPDEKSKVDLNYLSGIFSSFDVTHLLIVPSLYKILVTHIPEKLKSLQVVTVAGEGVNNDLVALHHARLSHVRLINEYGPTECAVCATATALFEQAKVTIGKPIDNVKVLIVDPDNNIQPIGVPGELYIFGSGVARGYLRNPALTSDRFGSMPAFGEQDARFYKTGDLAKWNADGNIEFLGRTDDQVKIRGIRVEPKEIEETISPFPGISGCAVLPQTNEQGEQGLVAFLTLTEHTRFSERELRNFLKAKLPIQLIPDRIIEIEKFPLTPNGKLDKKALLKIGDSVKERLHSEPTNKLESDVLEIWAQVLGRADFGIDDDFFELGGHSLKGTIVISKVQQALNVKLSINDLFVHKTVRTLTAHIQQSAYEMSVSIENLPIADSYELSHAQKRLWILSQADGNESTFNMVGAYVMQGTPHVAAFESALQCVVKRHESLRTVFTLMDGEPRQVIVSADKFNFTLQQRDIHGYQRSTQEIEALIQKELHFRFDLADGQLIRATLVKVHDTRFIFLLNIHHIICDGWSLGVFIEDLTLHYNELVRSRNVVVRPLPVQFKDFAAYHNRMLSQGRLEASRSFWLNELSGKLVQSEFPIDFNRTEQKTYRGKATKFQLDRGVTDQLRVFSQKQETSLFMTFATCIYTLLHYYSGANDLLIGSPVAGRTHHDLQKQIGLYLNILPLRITLDVKSRFSEFLQLVKAKILAAFNHQLYPLDEMIKDLNIVRSSSRSPLFETGITWQNHGVSEHIRLDDVIVTQLPVDSPYAQHDIWFYGAEDTDYITFEVVYNADLFLESTVKKIVSQFIRLIELAMQEDKELVSYITALSENQVVIQEADARLSEEF
jgi:amino acid adenylation domain-containing protein